MATTLYDPTSGWRSYVLQARTDAAGSAVDDAGGEDLRTVLDAFYIEGIVTPATAFQVLEDSPTGMTVLIGSGTAKADHAVIDGDISGQGAYLARMEDATVTLTVPAADLSNPRIDEVYLIVQDNAYDSSARVLPRIAYRDGTAATSPSAPGPDAAWEAFMLVATVDVAAGATTITNSDITDNRVYTGVTLAGLKRLGVAPGNSTLVDGPAGGLVALRIDGTNELTVSSTTLDVQGNSISNVGTVDGVDVSAHGTRHIQGGADSIEVDNSTEVASQALTGSYTDIATVSLSIPAEWNSWKVRAYAKWREGGGGAGVVRLRLDGTDQTETSFSSGDRMSIAARRTGITTTGSRTIALRAQEQSGSAIFSEVYLDARAVRTS